MRKINRIILHCTATKEGRSLKRPELEDWHKNQRGFRDIGYHYIVDIDGEEYFGRYEHEVGAHSQGQNHDSLGLCYVGGLDSEGKAKDTRTPKQKERIKNRIKDIRKRYGAHVTVHGHNEFHNKACPCFNVKMENL